MKGVYYEDWERKRSELNHNWLSNNYLDQLKALNAYMQEVKRQDDLRYRHEIRRLVMEVFPQWEHKREEIIQMVEEIEKDLTPTRLFDKNPLKKVSSRNKTWLEPLIHQLWMLRKDVRSQTEFVIGLCNAIDKEYNELKDEYHRINIITDRITENCYNKLVDYISLCSKLATKFSDLVALEKIV